MEKSAVQKDEQKCVNIIKKNLFNNDSDKLDQSE